MTFEQLRTAVRNVKERTDKPFGVNYRADQPDLVERLRFALGEGVRVASFAGPPTKDAIARVHDAGGVVMSTVGAKRHAEKMLEWGIDAVIAQGGEGGGHTGEVPTSLLVPSVVDAVAAHIPVLGAGGFHDGRGLVAALAYGADGIAMGTRFLLSADSRVPDDITARYLETGVTETVRTVAIDGKPQRVIRTPFIDKLEHASTLVRLPRAAIAALKFRSLTGTSFSDLLKEGLAMKKSQELTWSQMAMAANSGLLTKVALVDGKPDVGILPTGQVVGVIDELPTVQQILTSIMDEAEQTLKRLNA
jgi:NAD(P)H-dependent flavin oxidoreductase YrpB (nitropropane dioxygenase family)